MLITFEGIDGSGKSTQAHLLVERLKAEGFKVMLLREPGGTLVSERIRGLLLAPKLHIEPFAELLLFSAARAQLVGERIRPALAQGGLIVCDRFFDSTTAYQGAGRGLEDLAWLQAFNRRVTGGLVPARTYLIELAPEAALARRISRLPQIGTGEDRMEAAGIAFQARVAAAYTQMAEAESERILRLKGTQSIEQLQHQIWSDVQQQLAQCNGIR